MGNLVLARSKDGKGRASSHGVDVCSQGATWGRSGISRAQAGPQLACHQVPALPNTAIHCGSALSASTAARRLCAPSTSRTRWRTAALTEAAPAIDFLHAVGNPPGNPGHVDLAGGRVDDLGHGQATRAVVVLAGCAQLKWPMPWKTGKRLAPGVGQERKLRSQEEIKSEECYQLNS